MEQDKVSRMSDDDVRDTFLFIGIPNSFLKEVFT